MTQPDDAERTLTLLDRVPAGLPVALVLRHAEREEITSGTFGNDVSLTRRGSDSAHRLGIGLSSLMMSVVKSSPLPRCMQTADAIIAGAGWKTSAMRPCPKSPQFRVRFGQGSPDAVMSRTVSIATAAAVLAAVVAFLEAPSVIATG